MVVDPDVDAYKPKVLGKHFKRCRKTTTYL